MSKTTLLWKKPGKAGCPDKTFATLTVVLGHGRISNALQRCLLQIDASTLFEGACTQSSSVDVVKTWCLQKMTRGVQTQMR